ncbi:MAG: RNA polymerase sigma factor [Halocynthiibacter sp.]
MVITTVMACRSPTISTHCFSETSGLRAGREVKRGRSIGNRANSHDGETDDDLVAAMAGGEGAALAVLLDRHGGRIAALARRMLGPGGDADEIVQETFLRLWSRAAIWQPGRAKLSTWLHRVAANLAIDRLRKSASVGLDEAPEPIDHRPLPDAGLASQEASILIDRALAELAPRQRLAITLCHHSELSNIEAAEIMGISVEAIESLLARGRQGLKQILMADRHWLLEAASRGAMPAPANTEDGANGI